MKKLSVIWLSFAMFPVLYMIYRFFIIPEDNSYLSMILCVLACTAGIFYGIAIRFFMYKAEQKHIILVNISEGVAALIPSVYFLINHNFIIAATVAFLTFLGLKIFAVEYESVISIFLVAISSVLYLFSTFVFSVSKIDYPLTAYGIILILFYFISFFLQNRKNIDRLMNCRQYDKKYLPEESRKLNFRITAVICICCALVLILKNPVSLFIKSLIVYTGKLILFISKIFSKTEQIADTPAGEMQNTAAEELSELISSLELSTTPIIILTLVILWLNRKSLADTFQSILMTFAEFWTNIFSSKENKTYKKSNDCYTDYYEYLIDLLNKMALKRLKRRIQLKNWNDEYKRYHTITNPEEKFRLGYRLLISWISQINPSLNTADTPNEMAAKTKNEEFKKLTENYYPIRYGKSDVDENDILLTDELLRTCKKETKKYM